MMALIGQMSICIVLSLLIGGAIGWMVSAMYQTKKGILEVSVLKDTLQERDRQLQTLEASYGRQQQKLNKLTDEGIAERHKLLQTSNLLRKTSDELYRVEGKLKDYEAIKRENLQLKEEIAHIKTALVESTSTKASEQIFLELEISKLKKIQEEQRQEIATYQEKLQEYSDPERLLMTHDQLHEIEKRMREYQAEIKALKAQQTSSSTAVDSSPVVRSKVAGIVGRLGTWVRTQKEGLGGHATTLSLL